MGIATVTAASTILWFSGYFLTEHFFSVWKTGCRIFISLTGYVLLGILLLTTLITGAWSLTIRTPRLDFLAIVLARPGYSLLFIPHIV